MTRIRLRARTAIALIATAAAVLAAAPSPAVAAEPLLTVGVDVVDANLTHATYALYVGNHGSASAGNAVVSTDVPANTTFANSERAPMQPQPGAAACTPGAAPGTTCRWVIGHLAPGESRQITVSYALDDASYSVFNRATVRNGVEPPGGADASDTDGSLTRTVTGVEDAHVDDTKPDRNFGQCPQLRVRRDNTVTAFLEPPEDIQLTLQRSERVWGAELQATIDSVSPAAPVPIAAHRVVSQDWTEGAGADCDEGADGSGREVRAPSASEPRTEPPSDAAPVATTTVSGPGVARWDIAATLDTSAEAYEFDGIELRTGASIGFAADTVAFRSSEAPSSEPRFVSVHTNPEADFTHSSVGGSDSCIDTDPETTTGPSDREQRIEAYVTDSPGAGRPKVSGRITNSSGDDACPGFPVSGAPVGWELDDDAPDAYISSLEGVATTRETGSRGDAAPNRASTRTDANGRTYAGVRLGEPYRDGANAGESRVAAIVLIHDHNGANDAPVTRTSGVCEPGELDQTASSSYPLSPCLEEDGSAGDGEGQEEDDIHVNWTAVPAPPTADPVPTGGGGDAGVPSGGTASEPAPSHPRSIALAATRSRAGVGQGVRLTGQLTSSGSACTGPSQYVRILRRDRRASEFVELATVSTEPNGNFELPLLVGRSREYMAVVPPRGACAAASSNPVDIASVGRVGIGFVRRTTAGGRRTAAVIRGRVRPTARGLAVLQVRAGRRWQRVSHRRLRGRSLFSFPIPARQARRTFRVRWVSPTPHYLGAVSRSVTLRTRPAARG